MTLLDELAVELRVDDARDTSLLVDGDLESSVRKDKVVSHSAGCKEGTRSAKLGEHERQRELTSSRRDLLAIELSHRSSSHDRFGSLILEQHISSSIMRDLNRRIGKSSGASERDFDDLATGESSSVDGDEVVSCRVGVGDGEGVGDESFESLLEESASLVSRLGVDL